MYYEYIITKRSLIIRRFESVKRAKNLNIKVNNNSFTNNSINERLSKNKEINTQMNKAKSPSKFLELQDNIKSSMMKINQDNYIQMFNELFMKQRENSMDKKCKSPFIGIGMNMNDSFEMNNSENFKYNKYKTKTNNDVFNFPKNMDYIQKNIEKYKDIKDIDIINAHLKNHYYKYNKEKKHKGNIFDDDESLLPVNNNYSIDANIKKEKEKENSDDKKIFDLSDKKYNNKKNILYSKPLLTKSMSREGGIVKKNNLNIINLKKSERKILNNSMSNNNMISPIKSVRSLKNIPKSNKKENKKNEIIVKNVHTKDNKLNVFIKYIKLQTYEKNRFQFDKLIYSHTDSISLINNKYIEINKDNINKSVDDKDNINKSVDEINQQETIDNNSDHEEEDDNKIIYLFNFLQNIFNDNKKTILYNFWKNLKKIKNSFILRNSLQSSGRYKSMRFNNKQTNNNIIDLTKYKPQKNIIRNKKEKNDIDFNFIKSNENFDEKINKNKKNMNFIFYNKSCNNIFDKKEIKGENNNDNINDDSEKKEQLKKIKLAKLGKLFKNLEQENNIINTIKEQFLDWTFKNDINLKQEKETSKENKNNKKNYGLRTFNVNNNILLKNDKSNLEEKYEQIISNFRIKLISAIIKSTKEK